MIIYYTHPITDNLPIGDYKQTYNHATHTYVYTKTHTTGPYNSAHILSALIALALAA